MAVVSNQRQRSIRRVDLRPALVAKAPIGGALAASAAVTAIALPLGRALPGIGAPLVALVVGMGAGAVLPTERIRAGLGATGRQVLKAAIVLLGTTISLGQVVAVGAGSVPVMLGSLAGALLAAALLGRRFGVGTRLRTLIGVGTGICGASAIASVAGSIDARESEVRYAITTIFAFNLAAVLIFPPLGHALGLGPHAFGLWAGTAVNDASSVVAAGFAYGHGATSYALVVKLVRTTMIVPISLALAAATARGRRGSGDHRGRPSIRGVVPWFLVWFLAASALDSAGAIGAGAHATLSHLGLALTTLALGAVGLSGSFREMRATGVRPLVLGASVWGVVAVTSLGLQLALNAA
jgi:uncharacterized integral membrane protein (TIGR00698 family)